MAGSNKMLKYCVLLFACVFICNGDTIQKISRRKCEEYGKLINTCIESSGTEGTAKSGDYPHMALLGYQGNRENEINWSCAGVLISDQYVLTVAHCLTFRNATVIRFGELNTKSEDDNANIQDIKISKIIPHPHYKPNTFYNDIGLIKLEKPVQFNEYVRPACLPDIDEIIDFSNQKFIKSGWGLLPMENVKEKPYLFYNKNLRVTPHETCQKSYPSIEQLPNGLDENSQLCFELHEGACQIISGSPIQIKDKDIRCMHKIIGLVSFAYGKCKNNPEVSTKVSSYVNWIETNVWP